MTLWEIVTIHREERLYRFESEGTLEDAQARALEGLERPVAVKALADEFVHSSKALEPAK